MSSTTNNHHKDTMGRSKPLHRGYESLIFRVLCNIDSMGESKPKSVEKLRNVLKKWTRVVMMFDPFDVLEKNQDLRVKVGREVSVRVPETVVTASLQKSVLASAKVSGCTISAISDTCPYNFNLVDNMKKNTSHLTSGLLNKCPDSNHFQQKVDKLVRMLQCSVNGSQKCQPSDKEAHLNNILTVALKNMQRYNYIDIDSDGKVTYNFPSRLLIRVMHNLLNNYQNDVTEAFSTSTSFGDLKCCTTISLQCSSTNSQLEELADNMSEEGEMLSIISGALDALHKWKPAPEKPDGYSNYYEKPLPTSLSETSNELFDRVFLGNTSYGYSRSRSRSITRSRSRSWSRSRSRSNSSSDSIDSKSSRSRGSRSKSPMEGNLSQSISTSRSRSNTTKQSMIRCKSRSPDRGCPPRPYSRSSGTRSRSLSSNVSQHSDSDIEVIRRKRPLDRSLSPTTKRIKMTEDATLKADRCIAQANILESILGLEIYDAPGENNANKANDFEELCNELKALSVEDIAKLPEDMCVPDLLMILALDKMGDSKPRSVKSLMNALRPVCKVIFVLDPHKLVIQNKVSGKSKVKGKADRNSRSRLQLEKYLPLATLNLTETISLSKGGLFDPRKVPHFIPLNFPDGKMMPKKGSRLSQQNLEVHETLERLRKSELNADSKVERDEVFQKLVKIVTSRAHSIGSTVVKARREDRDFFAAKFVAWKQVVIKRRNVSVPMDCDHVNVMDSLGLDFKNRESLYGEMGQLFTKMNEISFEKMLSLLLETNLITKTADGGIIYTTDFEEGQWKSDWKSHEEALLKSLQFRADNPI